MRAKAHHQNKFVRFITTPIRVLNKAMDFYVKRITNCAEKYQFGNIIGVPVADIPRSFSVGSSRSNSNDDFRELVKVATTRTLGNRVSLNLYMEQHKSEPLMESKVVSRSCSVGMGRIDEDMPFVFGEDESNVNVKKELMYPRSRSYAVTKTSVVLF